MNFSDGGEVKEEDKKPEPKQSGLAALMHLLKHDKQEISAADAIDPIVEVSQAPVNDATKNYAGGGEVTSIPPLSATAATMNQTPDTNYDFYKDVGSDQRAALYQQLLDKQNSGGNLMAQAAGGIGDAISNSFGGQHNNFQNEAAGIAAKNTENRIGQVDTQRAQKLQDMQGNQEMMMNDPKGPFAEGMRAILKSQGVPIPSGMSAAIMLKALGPLGELSYKQAMMGMQAPKITEEINRSKASTTNQETERRHNAAKGLQDRPWYQKAFEAATPFKSDATKEMQSELKEQGAAPQGAGHGIPDLGSTFNGGKVVSVKRVK